MEAVRFPNCAASGFVIDDQEARALEGTNRTVGAVLEDLLISALAPSARVFEVRFHPVGLVLVGRESGLSAGRYAMRIQERRPGEIAQSLRKGGFAHLGVRSLEVESKLTAHMCHVFDALEEFEGERYSSGATAFRVRHRFFGLDGGKRLLSLGTPSCEASYDGEFTAPIPILGASELRVDSGSNAFLNALVQFDLEVLPLAGSCREEPFEVRVDLVLEVVGPGAPHQHRRLAFDDDQFRAIHTVRRCPNFAGGVSVLQDSKGERVLKECRLRDPLDSIYLWNRAVSYQETQGYADRLARAAHQERIVIGISPLRANRIAA